MKTALIVCFSALVSGSIAQSVTNPSDQSVPGDKSEWIQKNPEAYKAMGGQINESEPARASIAAEGAGRLISIPDFPQFVDTGNPEEDALAFEKAKADWYAKMFSVNEANGVYFQSGDAKESWIQENPTLYFMK